MPEFDDDALLTKKQLARALNTSERTIEGVRDALVMWGLGAASGRGR